MQRLVVNALLVSNLALLTGACSGAQVHGKNHVSAPRIELVYSRPAFEDLDQNQDGSITESEVTGPEWDRLEALDENGDWLVSRREYGAASE